MASEQRRAGTLAVGRWSTYAGARPGTARNNARRLSARLVALIAMAVFGAACSDDPVSGEVGERLRMRAAWQQQGLVYYTVEARILCYCPPAMNAWHELTVSSDSIIAIQRIDGESGGPAAVPAWFSTVDEVYRRMDRWGEGERGYSIRAQYDATTGLPTRVELNTSPNIQDGGATYEFRALKPGLTGLQ